MNQLHSAADSANYREAALERLWALTLLLGEGMGRGLAERGLTVARSHLLWLLSHDGASTQRALSRALRVTPRNITGLVDALEADGLVARTAHPSDRRATLVTLTEKGTAVVSAMRRDQEQFARLIFADLSPGELDAFMGIMDRILSRVRSVLP